MRWMVLIAFLVHQRVEQHHLRHIEACVHHITLFRCGRNANIEFAHLRDGGQRAQPLDQLCPVFSVSGSLEPEEHLMTYAARFPASACPATLTPAPLSAIPVTRVRRSISIMSPVSAAWQLNTMPSRGQRDCSRVGRSMPVRSRLRQARLRLNDISRAALVPALPKANG